MTNEFQQLIDNITPEIYQRLKVAVEIGRWPNGVKLTDQQRQLSLQAVIAYEKKNLSPEECSGYVPPVTNTLCAANKQAEQQEQRNETGSETVRWMQ